MADNDAYVERPKPKLHVWSYQELNELFYDALLRDHRSEGYTAPQMRMLAHLGAIAAQKDAAKVASVK